MARTVAEQVGVDPRPSNKPDEFTVPAQDQQPQVEPEPERPSWLPENFKSPEDLAKSYQEAQRALTQATQRASAAEESAAAIAQRIGDLEQTLAQQQQQYQPPDAENDPWLAAEVDAWEQGDYQRALKMRDMRTVQMLQAAQQMFAQQNPQQPPQPDETVNQIFAIQTDHLVAQQLGGEWNDEMRAAVGDFVRERPYLIPETNNPVEAANAVTMVARMVRSERLAEQNGSQEPRQLGNQANQSAFFKQQAQTLQGSSGPRVGGLSPEDALVERWRQLPRRYGS